MQHTNTLRTFCVALGVAGKGKYGKTCGFFREMQQQNCIVVKIVFFFPTSFTCFAFGTVLHKNVTALAGVFPISCQWKDISVYHPYIQYSSISGTHKMPCSSSLPNHQHLHSDARNSHGFLCASTAAAVCVILCAC